MERKGFTLIELLVVISIIALLLAVLMPALNKAKEQSRAVVCCSNVKQFALGLSLYETIHGIFPPAKERYSLFNPGAPPGGWVEGNKTMAYWFQYAAAELGEGANWKTLHKCPSNRLDYDEGYINASSDITIGNYTVNLSIIKAFPNITTSTEFQGKSLNLSKIKNQSETILLLDGGTVTTNWQVTSFRWAVSTNNRVYNHSYIPGMPVNRHPVAGRNLEPMVLEDAHNGRHLKRQVNVAFVDGHAERKKSEEIEVDPDWNGTNRRMNMWVPR